MEIILIHGFSSLKGEERLKLLIEEIRKEVPETKIIVPNYLERYGGPRILLGRKSVSGYAKICKTIIEKKSSNDPQQIIIGYSLGGIIARVLIEKMGIEPQAVILVATPNKGIKFHWRERIFSKIFRRPRTIKDIIEGSKFLQDLNVTYNKRRELMKTRYYLVAGTKDTRVPLDSAAGIEGEETILVDVSHPEFIPREPTLKTNALSEIIKILKKEVGLSPASFFFGQNLNFLLK